MGGSIWRQIHSSRLAQPGHEGVELMQHLPMPDGRHV